MATIYTLNEEGESAVVTTNVTAGVAKTELPMAGGKKPIKRKDLEDGEDSVTATKKLSEAFLPFGKEPQTAQEHQEVAQAYLKDMSNPENDSKFSNTQYQYHMGMHHLKRAEEAEKAGAKVTAARHRSLAKDLGVLHEESKEFSTDRDSPAPKFPVTARDMTKSSKWHESQINDNSELSKAEYWHRKHADAWARKDKTGMKEAEEHAIRHLERHLQNIQHAELARHFAKMHHLISYDDARAAGNNDLAAKHLKKSKEFDY